jgi:DNA-binding response OmpR family regulator
MTQTILMADDDKFFLQVVARFLGDAGYRVVTCLNGQEALEAASVEHPDLMVLDVALPLVTGDQVATRLGDGRPPILFISGRDLDRVAGLVGPRFKYLTKPADLDDILSNVQELLAAES